jgi:hypothetical protein
MLVCLLIVTLARAGVVVTLPSTSQEIELEVSAASELEGAMGDLAAGRFEVAARRFEALAKAGSSADLWYLLAVAEVELGELHRAEVAIREGFSRNSNHAPLLALKAFVLAEAGRGAEALVTLDRAGALATSDAVLRARIGLHRGRVRLDRPGGARVFRCARRSQRGGGERPRPGGRRKSPAAAVASKWSNIW